MKFSYRSWKEVYFIVVWYLSRLKVHWTTVCSVTQPSLPSHLVRVMCTHCCSTCLSRELGGPEEADGDRPRSQPGEVGAEEVHQPLSSGLVPQLRLFPPSGRTHLISTGPRLPLSTLSYLATSSEVSPSNYPAPIVQIREYLSTIKTICFHDLTFTAWPFALWLFL